MRISYCADSIVARRGAVHAAQAHAGHALVIAFVLALGATAGADRALAAACDTGTYPRDVAEVGALQGRDNVAGKALAGETTMGSNRFDQGKRVTVRNCVQPLTPPGGVKPDKVEQDSTQFHALSAAGGQLALVRVYGTPEAFGTPEAIDSITFGKSNLDGTTITPVTSYASIDEAAAAAGLSAAVVAGARALPAIPAGWSAPRFFVVGFSGSSSEAWSYRAVRNGVLGYNVVTLDPLEAPLGASRSLALAGTTRLLPRLDFATAANANVGVDTCSAQLRVRLVDGSGAAAVQPRSEFGNSGRVRLLFNGTPANVFLDASCAFPTTSMEIRPSGVAPDPTRVGARPPSVVNTGYVPFYFKGNRAQTFPIAVAYVDDNDDDRVAIKYQEQTIVPNPPVNARISGPSAVNQLACSMAMTTTLLDQFGNSTVAPAGGKSLGLVAGGSAQFFADDQCARGISSIAVSAGSGAAMFYLRGSVPEKVKVTVSASGLASASIDVSVLALGSSARAASPEAARRLALKLHDRLAGTPISLKDPMLARMEALLLEGKSLEAAALVTQKDDFYNLTVRSLANRLSNRLFNALEPLNDFTATWIGVVRDARDARELLTGNYTYVPRGDFPGRAATPAQDPAEFDGCATDRVYRTNVAFRELDDGFVNLRTDLRRVRQCAFNSDDFSITRPILLEDTAGLLTTRAWGQAHLLAGTNRRAVEFAAKVFLCKEISELADGSMPDHRIRQDVDRAPAGDPQIYNASCRSCHGGLDGLAGAFAFFDAYQNPMQGSGEDFRLFFVNKGSTYLKKVNGNAQVFPAGWKTNDATWVNHFVANQNEKLGWAGDVALRGEGVNSLGRMLASSSAFPSCMAKRVFTEVCKRAASDSEQPLLEDLARDFKASDYNMRRLFEKAATLSVCIGNGE